MKKLLFILCVTVLLVSCKQGDQSTDTVVSHQPSSPQFEPCYDRSNPPTQIDVAQALRQETPLRLSKIASKLEYYNVGDAGFKALAYKWNNQMNGLNLFYDKKMTRMYFPFGRPDRQTIAFTCSVPSPRCARPSSVAVPHGKRILSNSWMARMYTNETL